jgi:hypothetical protein
LYSKREKRFQWLEIHRAGSEGQRPELSSQTLHKTYTEYTDFETFASSKLRKVIFNYYKKYEKEGVVVRN